MSNLQMISPINLQSADVNLFYSSNLLLSQLLEAGKGNFVCLCMYTVHMQGLCEHMYCRWLLVHLCYCVCTHAYVCLYNWILCQCVLGQRNRWSTKWDMHSKRSQLHLFELQPYRTWPDFISAKNRQLYNVCVCVYTPGCGEITCLRDWTGLSL